MTARIVGVSIRPRTTDETVERLIAAGESLALCCAQAEPFLSPKLAAYYRVLLSEWEMSVRGYKETR